MEKDSAICRVDSAGPIAGRYVNKQSRHDSATGELAGPGHTSERRKPNLNDEVRRLYSLLPLLDRFDIRMCHILPGSDEDPIVVALTGHKLADLPEEYDALSYPWGAFEDDARHYITVNDVTFEVTRNLLTMLRRLRCGGVQRVWVDAIGIYQGDDIEKTAQVCLMARIFSQATVVYVAFDELGMDLHDAPMAHSLVKATLEKLAENADTHINIEAYRCLLVPEGDVLAHEASRLLLRLLKSAWFTRTWVIQEVSLARSPVLLCSWGVMPWQTLSDALNHWNNHYQTECCGAPKIERELKDALYNASNYAISIDRAKKKMQEGCHILEYVIQFRPLLATNVRDKFNAFRGMHTTETKLPLPNPGYTNTIAHFFEDVSVWIIQEQQSLMICAMELEHGTDTLECPSWVADLSAELHVPVNYWQARLSFYALFKCGLRIPWYCEYVPDSGRLVLQGALIDTVHAVSDDFLDLHELSRPSDYFELLKRLSSFAAEEAGPAIKNDSPGLDEFVLTITGGWVWLEDGRVRKAYPSDHPDFKGLLMHIAKHSSFDALRRHRLFRSHITAILRRRLIRTTSCALGMAPLSVRERDKVVLLAGGNLPFILRPVAGHEQQYNMIGMCYLPAYVEGLRNFSIGAIQRYGLA